MKCLKHNPILISKTPINWTITGKKATSYGYKCKDCGKLLNLVADSDRTGCCGQFSPPLDNHSEFLRPTSGIIYKIGYATGVCEVCGREWKAAITLPELITFSNYIDAV